MKKKYPVILSDTERDDLKRLIATGTAPARKLTHARILLKADESAEGAGWVDEKVADAVEVSQPTVSLGCASSILRRVFRRPSTAVLRSGSTIASWMGSRRRRASSLWPAHSRPRVTLAGACGCWRIGWWSLK
jgi:hypothetical protein